MYLGLGNAAAVAGVSFASRAVTITCERAKRTCSVCSMYVEMHVEMHKATHTPTHPHSTRSLTPIQRSMRKRPRSKIS